VVIEPTDWEKRLKIAVEKTLAARDARRTKRAEFKRRRDWGLAQRHAQKLARNRRAEQEKTMTRCRYLRRNDAQCTAEAVAEDEDLLLCSKHLARALELLQRKGIHLTATKEN